MVPGGQCKRLAEVVPMIRLEDSKRKRREGSEAGLKGRKKTKPMPRCE